ncbi:MAG: UvrD-helicase domain-containing protein [Marmoricola sp.]
MNHPTLTGPAAFELLEDLPTAPGTTVLEASAGTGKTWTIGALVTRYVAEGHATLDQLLVITFGRAATRELRQRVREHLVAGLQALARAGDQGEPDDPLLRHLCAAEPAERILRARRLQAALASYDAATIATTHEFCGMVLRSLGVAGDSDAGSTLVDNLDDLVTEVVDDVYLQRYGGRAEPPLTPELARRLGAAAVEQAQAQLVATGEPSPTRDERLAFATAVRAEVQRRKRRRGLLGYDDLLSRLADALDAPDSPARQRMRQRWKVVLVDEFQDTDPVQWSVLDRAFSGHATMVLIGDPKQAIYAFRGGDVPSYLDAAETAGDQRTLATNWRSDAPLVGALQALLAGAALGDPRILVHPVAAHHQGSRLSGQPVSAPVRLRRVRATDLCDDPGDRVPVDRARRRIADDLAADVARLLASGATYRTDDGPRPLQPGDVAILMYSLKQASLFTRALARQGIASVVTNAGSVLLSEAAEDWVALLEAMEQPQRSGRIRALALTPFLGVSPEDLDAGGDGATDDAAEAVRGWLDLFRSRGVAAVTEAVVADGLAARVLGCVDGERRLTDLQHLGQILHDVAHREHWGLSALLDWLRAERRVAARSSERARRLDTDTQAVQVLTIHGSKGLQYPIVYLPLLFNRWIADSDEVLLFHDPSGRRCLDVGGAGPTSAAARAALAEDAAEELRLTYVALTRAQSQVVTWWAPTRDARNSGLTRLLFGRSAGQAEVPDVTEAPADDDAATALERWQQAGALLVEDAQRGPAPALGTRPAAPTLSVRRFDRALDLAWRRTSYSGLIRADDPQPVTEAEFSGTVDEPEDATPETPVEETAAPVGPASPMADLPAGATFGSLVHAVLETADPQAPDLREELRRRAEEQLRWWSVAATPEALADGMLPMHATSLGPLAEDRTLVDLGRRDRLCELDFEIPLDGGDGPPVRGTEVFLAEVADLMRAHLPSDDPLLPYADRLAAPGLGSQALRGYLSGSIDVVLRLRGGTGPGGGDRYLVVDYKTNLLGEPGRPSLAWDYRPEALAGAMLHSHYPLLAMLYSVVLHRYLRWRQRDYDPERHLGGVLYLYVRGMAGADTPVTDAGPCGVFSWKPPAALVVALSDLLAGRGTQEGSRG